MKHIQSLFITLLALVPVAGSSQEVLSLEQCRSMALEHNKQLKASAHATRSAELKARSHKANFLPNIYASGTGLYSTADGAMSSGSGYLPTLTPDAATGALAANGGYAYFPGIDIEYDINAVFTGGITLEQPIYMGGKINAAYKMALLGRDIAEQQEAMTKTEVIEKTEEAFALVVRAKEMQKVAQSYNELLGQLQKTVESALRHGMKPKNDLLKVQVKLNESELAVRKADNALRLAKMNLCHFIGKPLSEDIDVEEYDAVGATHCGRPTPGQSLDISSRPEYSILEKQVDLASRQVRLYRSEMLPQIGLSASYNYAHGIEVNDHTLLDNGGFTALLNVNIPLFHFGERRHKVSAAKAELLKVQLEQQDANEKMTLELAQASNNLDEARLEMDLAVKSLEQAEENMRESRCRYSAGLETLSDLLEAQAMWQEASSQEVEATCQLRLAHIAFLKAAGKLLTSAD